MQTKPNLFIVEDNEHQLFFMKRKLKDFYEIVTASTVEYAREEFYKYPFDFFNIIAFDGTLEFNLDTLPLVEEFRPLFKGTMVAISDNINSNQKLFEAMQVDKNSTNYTCDKGKFIELAIDLADSL